MEIEYKEMPNDIALLGYFDGKWFVSSHSDEMIRDVMEKIRSGIVEIKNKTELDNGRLVVSQQNLTFNETYFFKVFAKISFNCLTYFIGEDNVLMEEFNPIRNWIMDASESANLQLGKFVRFAEEPIKPLEILELSQDSHCVLIFKKENRLIGVISLYGELFEIWVNLAEQFLEPFEMKAFICDWRNRKEYTIFE